MSTFIFHTLKNILRLPVCQNYRIHPQKHDGNHLDITAFSDKIRGKATKNKVFGNKENN
jgi:hypothetical protein